MKVIQLVNMCSVRGEVGANESLGQIIFFIILLLLVNVIMIEQEKNKDKIRKSMKKNKCV